MPDKDFEEVKKKVAEELKQLARKTEKARQEAEKLRAEQAELAKKKDADPADKTRQIDLRKAVENLHDRCETDASNTCSRINTLLKTNVPTDQKAIPEWQKGMEKWYRDQVEKEPGFDLGGGVKLSGQVSIKDKKAMLFLSGKF
jgi:hypothetical protein